MTNTEIAHKLVKLVGGKENINYVTHCITRCRLNFNDKKMVQFQEIDKVEGVLGIIEAEEEIQIIIGPGKIEDVTSQIISIVGNKIFLYEENYKKVGIIKRILSKIRN